MTPLRTFRIRPERRSRLSVQVEVYRTVTEFRDSIRHEDIRHGLRPSRTRGLMGCCTGVKERRRGRLTGLFAVIRLPRRYLTTGVITHEAFHATCRWAERLGLDAIPINGVSNPRSRETSFEERSALVHDTICRMMVRNFYRFKLLEP